MSDPLLPSPRLSISRWLLGVIITTALVGGGIAAVGLLFVADVAFDVGKDPVVAEQQDNVQDAEFERRLRLLELQVKQNRLADEGDAGPEPKKVEPQAGRNDTGGSNASDAGTGLATQVLLGLNQLKTAYENDFSLQQGIDSLRHSVEDKSVQEKLQELDAVTSDKAYVTRERILVQLNAWEQDIMQPAADDQEKVAEQDQTQQGWRAHAGEFLGKFVTVEHTADVQRRKNTLATLDKMQQAVAMDNMGLALQLLDSLPEDAHSTTLKMQLQARLKARELVQKTSLAINEALNKTMGSASATKGLY